MKPVVALIAPGNMGAAVARRLFDHGIETLTTLDGRSPASRTRAAAAGMIEAPLPKLVDVDLVLSILPPAAALPFAEQLSPFLTAARRKPVFVDCNAVNPETVGRIAAVVEQTGASFVDAAIIGLPPVLGAPCPHFYAAGAAAGKFAELSEFGLDIRLLKGPIGAASALKMSFAGINKGITTVAAAMILAATRAGAADALRQELSESDSPLLAALGSRMPAMFPKAYRWVAEMHEIAEFVKEDRSAQEIFLGAAALYERLARDFAGEKIEISDLARFAS